jgi:hypothetical protein
VTITEAYLSGCISYYFPCTFAGNTPAGTLFNFSASVSAQGEQDFQFNTVAFVATVLNSYDPNDKQCNLPTFIQPDFQEELEYMVRFQNDGNYPALNVDSGYNLKQPRFVYVSFYWVQTSGKLFD